MIDEHLTPPRRVRFFRSPVGYSLRGWPAFVVPVALLLAGIFLGVFG